jgi:hypothetical protein
VSGAQLPDVRPADLFAALIAHHVRFLVVGGIGAQLHGALRTTDDLDVVVPWTRDNFDVLTAALEDLDARLDLPFDLGDLQVRPSAALLARMSITRWQTRAGIVDVLQAIPAGEGGESRDFGQLERRAVAAPGGADGTVLVAALDDIIASKEHADREKDREALPELYALRDRQAGGDSWAEETR